LEARGVGIKGTVPFSADGKEDSPGAFSVVGRSPW
jgi:hypothetical protein